MTTNQKHSSDGTLNEPENTRHIEKIAKLFGLDKQNIELKRRVNLLEAEIEDLDECVDKETLVDLIQEMVPSLIIRKYKKRGLLCEHLNRSDSSLSDSSLSEDSETSKRIILTDIRFGVDMGANANYISRKNVIIAYAKDDSIPRVNGFLDEFYSALGKVNLHIILNDGEKHKIIPTEFIVIGSGWPNQFPEILLGSLWMCQILEARLLEKNNTGEILKE
ncbi:6354_t:CDS:2 [Dentiscutata erythropus]|uniref:6354_t:CDS:1 n=1 Tax=Dentiscutata erythropus TaxID=1348616 RepID=A0A9N9JGR7_9GLOM|nr:6354_t:CDS:2 [Dentiscutata erythropus]